MVWPFTFYFAFQLRQKRLHRSNCHQLQSRSQKNKGSCIYNPGIKLNGADTVCIPLKGSFIDEGASAIDADGSKPIVSVENQVNTAKKGIYQVRYSAELQSGVAEVTRKVIVAIDRSNWVGIWKTNDNCGSIFFPDSMVTFVLGN